MSNGFGEAFAELEAYNKAVATYETFGHLEPKPGKYKGKIIFIHGTHGDIEIVDWKFKNIDSSPGMYEDINYFIGELAEEEEAKEIGVYEFEGFFTRAKKAENNSFTGTITKLIGEIKS